MADPTDGEGIDTTEGFDFAIMAIFTTLVFDISTQFGQHRQQLQTSDYWSKTEQKLEEGLKGMRNASLQAIALSLVIITATAIGVSIPCVPLEERMVWILEGLSYLVAALVCGMLSFQVAYWIGVYPKVWEAPARETSRTLKEVKFKVRWSYYRIFTRYYFFLIPFYQGVIAMTIPVSMLSGIAAGLLVDYCVYLTRRTQKRKLVRRLAGLVLFIIVCASSLLLATGVWYIALVWDHDEDPKSWDEWWILSLFVCFFLESLLHVGYWWSSRNTTTQFEGKSPNQPRMAFSLIASVAHNNKTRHDPLEQLEAICEEEEAEESEPVEEDIGEPEPGDGSPEVPDPEDGSPEDPNEPEPDDGSPEEPISEGGNRKETDEVDPKAGEEEDYESPTHRQMLLQSWTCCGCVRGDDKSRSEKTWLFLSWTVWLALVFFSLVLVIVNLGATVQQEAAREKLPYVFETLYKNIDEGPVCAFDNKGPDSNITAFANKEAAHEAGFLIVHCGACAACSDWHNLRLEYTTRNYLADESARCGRKSLSGGRDAVLECLESDAVGFQGKCAECWADDILCTKGFCTMIFLQAITINAVSDMQVNAETITAAACEEAHCEADNPGDFVYCSGATRRRMNVTSTISRPGAQRCGIVDVDWAEVFPE